MLTVSAPELMVPENIDIPERLRQLDKDRVETIAESMQKIGLQTPISVRSENDGEFVYLVAGRHRLEAALRLGWDQISVVFVEGSSDHFRLWEIAENLHRAELTPLERSEHIAEWIRLTEKKQSAQLAPIEGVSKRADGKGHRKASGTNAASKAIGVERTEAQRAIKIDSISPEAKQAARENGLDKNQSALLKVAAAAPERQVEAVAEVAKKPAPPPQAESKGAASQAVDLLRDKLGEEYGAFLEIIKPVGAQRFWAALFTSGCV